jgi:transketolase
VKIGDRLTQRSAYGKTLAEIGEEVPQIVVLDADISKSTCTYFFAKMFPKRAFNLGVAEQNMFGVAAGLAMVGKIPFASTYACFATMRACEQIRTSIAYPHLNVKIVATHGGIEVGWDGVTHQGTEDVGIMRSIPGMVVLVPADPQATVHATHAISKYEGPVYMRLGRNPMPVLYGECFKFTLGKAHVLQTGADIAIMTTGPILAEAIKAATVLEKEGISSYLLDVHTIKPIDREAIVRAAKTTGAVVTCEDHNINGGLGSAVSEVLVEEYPVPMMRVGLQDTFGESGEPKALYEKYKLSERFIVEAARRALKRKM